MPTKLSSLKGLYTVGLIRNFLCRSLRYIVPIYLYVCVCVCVLFQICVLLKDSRISPFVCSKKDFDSKATDRGVCLHGATSKRDSMWHSAVFTCIRANRVAVKRIKRTVIRSYEMQVDLPSHCANRSLLLVKFFVGINTDKIISADARK